MGLRYDLDVSTVTAGRGRMQMLEPALSMSKHWNFVSEESCGFYGLS